MPGQERTAATQPRGPARRRWLRALLLGGLVATTALLAAVVHGNRVVAGASEGRLHTVEDAPETPVAMVLGALAHPGRPSSFLAARLDLALELWERGAIRAVLVSGAGGERDNFQTAVMRDYLLERGVPDASIVEDPAGFDTYDSCVRARDVFGVERLVIVSQEYHLARASGSPTSRWAGTSARGASRSRTPSTRRCSRPPASPEPGDEPAPPGDPDGAGSR